MNSSHCLQSLNILFKQSQAHTLTSDKKLTSLQYLNDSIWNIVKVYSYIFVLEKYVSVFCIIQGSS